VTAEHEVRLTVPAMPEFLRLARVTAAGLASRLGFSFDDVDDLRLAIDELCFGLIGSQGHPNGTVEVSYRVQPDRLEVVGRGRFPGDPDPPRLSELSTVILSALVDEHEMTFGTDGPCFRLVKRRE
jgi:anti-sigma regulatory factor (Ser/Thr protein kinase)